MRVLIFAVEELRPGRGPHNHVRECFAYCRRFGHHAELIAGGSAEGICPPELFHRLRFRLSGTNEIIDFIRLAVGMITGIFRVLRHAGDFDVVYARDFWSALALPAVLLRGKPLVAELNGIPSELRRQKGAYLGNRLYIGLINALERIAYPRCRQLICVTDGIRDYFLRRYPSLRAERVTTVDNGANLELFRPPSPAARTAARARLGFGEECVICYCGSFTRWQPVTEVVTAVAALRREGLAARLLLVGDGPLRDELAAVAVRAGLDDAVTFTGRVPYQEVPDYLAAADVCVSPRLAGLHARSLKLLDYLAAGRPVVATRIPDVEFVLAAACGLLVDPGDSAGWCRALRELAADAALRDRYGRQARRLAEERFSWTVAYDRIFGLLANVVGKR